MSLPDRLIAVFVLLSIGALLLHAMPPRKPVGPITASINARGNGYTVISLLIAVGAILMVQMMR